MKGYKGIQREGNSVLGIRERYLQMPRYAAHPLFLRSSFLSSTFMLNKAKFWEERISLKSNLCIKYITPELYSTKTFQATGFFYP